MSTKYKFLDPDGTYFISFAIVDWIDLFTRDSYKEILLDAWRYCQKEKGLRIHAWVIMTNHVHMIISRAGEHALSDILRDMKKWTATQLLRAIHDNDQESRREWMLERFQKAGEANSNNTQYQFWQQDNHPILLPSERIKIQKLNYLHQNPVRAGFTIRPEYWTYSSAGDYYTGRQGKIELVQFYLDPDSLIIAEKASKPNA